MQYNKVNNTIVQVLSNKRKNPFYMIRCSRVSVKIQYYTVPLNSVRNEKIKSDKT